ncbi:homeobox Meis1-like [Brachionus plicatilis]|uniref:Homeobox Meis1-like n=1 Tax=Brachionus plicatilis TaxID=10195 RepID=A0A3M7RNN1_BRAPC|nr:homeobox Meis1-like [Brachionus plicatilis]
MLEKCELATCTPRDPRVRDDICTSQTLDDDFGEFSKQIRKEHPFYVPNAELDNLMIQAIQVLRFHLLELEKVHELCDDFCDRYIDRLKGKMPNELSLEENNSTGATSALNDAHSFDYSTSSTSAATPAALRQSLSTSNSQIKLASRPASQSNEHSLAALGQQGSAAPPSAHFNIDTNSETGDALDNSVGSNEQSGDDELEESSSSKKRQRKRGIFPKVATNMMRAWLFQHFSHPYPSEEQKKQLAQDTGLTILQVNNW